ncbi:hypothetical protein TSUD_291870 [Trifolium subterraneum]|uniref:Uncharacterized protein n=1 Tax=Trifolium subterraneum TaxID=3900 RepID=A0A2Z6NW70_TRISU|nr:hypothetical protein TSUD_291870 [Trifolium subterraneum]
MWLVRAFRGAACDSAWDKKEGVTLSCLEHCPRARQAPGKSRLAPSSISAGILLSRGWGPGANYSLQSCPNPRPLRLVRSIVLREGKRG